MKKRLSRYVTLLGVMLLMCTCVQAQRILTVHKADAQETVFGIAKRFGVTIDELKNSNPDMRVEGFVLKKGMLVNIPEHDEAHFPMEAKVKEVRSTSSSSSSSSSSTQRTTPRTAPVIVTSPSSTTTTSPRTQVTTVPVAPSPSASRNLTVGVMLPLHDINGDGKRMVEYYRGVLLAVNQLKTEGVNVTVNAWNLAEGDDARTALLDGRAEKCDVIFGPLYTTQVPALASFCSKKNIRLVIPFSISGTDVKTCPQIFQVYQNPEMIMGETIKQFTMRFGDSHPVFIDCNDATSKKGAFTAALRNALDVKGIQYNITNVNSAPEAFVKAFSTTKRNVVVLNTARSPELGQVFKKLEEMMAAGSSCKVTMFGYNEWFMYTKIYDQKYRRFDTYIPSVYDYNPESDRVKTIEALYTSYYKSASMQYLPNLAVTGYDQMMYFARGILTYGKDFQGRADQKAYTAIQTPYVFEHYANGGYQNRNFMLVHFK